MTNNKKFIIKAVIILLVVVGFLVFGVTIYREQIQQKPKAVLVAGFPKEQAKGLQKELEHAIEEANVLDRGDALLKEERIDDAIREYEKAFTMADLSGSRGVANICIANAYEKKRDYKKALEYVIIDRDKYVNDWAKEPIVERVKYLEYVLNGNYDLAVEHAQKALEADAKLPNRPASGRQDYIDRLNDLKAAKDYIMSLKKK